MSKSFVKSFNGRISFIQVHLELDRLALFLSFGRLEEVRVVLPEVRQRHFGLSSKDVAENVAELQGLHVQCKDQVLEVRFLLLDGLLFAGNVRLQQVSDFPVR